MEYFLSSGYSRVAYLFGMTIIVFQIVNKCNGERFLFLNDYHKQVYIGSKPPLPGKPPLFADSANNSDVNSQPKQCTST